MACAECSVRDGWWGVRGGHGDPGRLLPGPSGLQRHQVRHSRPQSAYIYRVQSSVWRLPNLTHHLHSTQRLCPPPRTKGGGVHYVHTRRAVRGSIVRKTPDIGLASYSIIPLRSHPSHFLSHSFLLCPPFLPISIGSLTAVPQPLLPAPLGQSSWPAYLMT